MKGDNVAYLLVEHSLRPVVGHGVPEHLVQVCLQLLPSHVLALMKALPHDAESHGPSDDLRIARSLRNNP